MKYKQEKKFEKIFKIGDKIHEQIISDYKSLLKKKIRKMKLENDVIVVQRIGEVSRYNQALADVLKVLEE